MAETRKTWLVEFPTYQYNEDVKALARQRNLIVYDAKFADQIPDEWVEKDPPKLTKVGEEAAKRGRKAAEE